MLVIGCDIGSETHYFRAVDSKGIELGKKAVSFPNNEEGFKGFKDWAVELSARNGKTQIVLGLEPTGHYWFTIARWMINNGITVVQVNPYAVKFFISHLTSTSSILKFSSFPAISCNLYYALLKF